MSTASWSIHTPVVLTKEKYGYVGVVKLHEYVKFIKDPSTAMIREAIFESNIRHYLGEVDVNKKISEKIKPTKKMISGGSIMVYL